MAENACGIKNVKKTQLRMPLKMKKINKITCFNLKLQITYMIKIRFLISFICVSFKYARFDVEKKMSHIYLIIMVGFCPNILSLLQFLLFLFGLLLEPPYFSKFNLLAPYISKSCGSPWPGLCRKINFKPWHNDHYVGYWGGLPYLFLRIPSCSSGFIQDFLNHYVNRCRLNDVHFGRSPIHCTT